MRGLLSVLEAIGGARVLVVGDVMLDRAIHGHAARLSPEAPVPVLSVEREEVRLGGAGNVLGNLRALCVESHLVAVVGDDGPGREIVHLAGVGHSLIVDSKRPTTVKERHFAGGQQLLRCDREDASPLSNAMAQQVMRVARNRLDEVDVLLLSDYGKGVLAPATTRALIAAAGEAGCPVVADPKGGDYGVYRGVAVITPNLNELQEASGWILGPDDDLTPACYDLLARTGVQAVLATQGARGMTLVRPDHPACHIPTSELIQVWDVTGAGDTVVALVAASLAVGVGLGGVDLERAARLASIAAGIAVGKAGTALVSRSEIRQALWADNGRQGGNDQPGEGKEVERDDLLARVNQWRSAGLTVGFTNGCFDLLHPGHVSLLRQARAACGRLVVGLNGDAAVARLKGRGRPYQTALARAAVLAGLADVDAVVIFEEDTPLALIQALQPDVLVKGADYAPAEVAGAGLLRGWGGKLILAELTLGCSTSATVSRLIG